MRVSPCRQTGAHLVARRFDGVDASSIVNCAAVDEITQVGTCASARAM